MIAFNDLTTLADVKAWLKTGQNDFPTTEDALLTRLITAASGFIRSWLNRDIVSQDWMEIRDGLVWPYTREARFQFTAWPVTAVLLVVADYVMIPPAAPIVITPPGPTPTRYFSQYAYAPAPSAGIALPGVNFTTSFLSQPGYTFTPTQLIIRGYRVAERAAGVMFQYTAGYTSIPFDVAQACIELVTRKYRERTHVGEVSRNIGGMETVSYQTRSFGLHDMTTDLQVLLQQYRRVTPVSGSLTQAPTQTDTATLAAAA